MNIGRSSTASDGGVESYGGDTQLLPSILSAAIVTLALAVLWNVWALRRHVRRRLATEGALRAEHAFRKAMEDSLHTGMRAVDLEGRIVYVNPAYCNMVGYPAEQLIGYRPAQPHCIRPPLRKRQRRRRLRGGRRWLGDRRLRRRGLGPLMLRGLLRRRGFALREARDDRRGHRRQLRRQFAQRGQRGERQCMQQDRREQGEPEAAVRPLAQGRRLRRSARHTFSGVSGISNIRTPTASYSALAIAGDPLNMPVSPMPLAPNGPPACGTSTSSAVISAGISSRPGSL